MVVLGLGAGIASAIACTGGPATGDGDPLGGSSGVSSSSGSSGSSGPSSSSSSSGSSGSTVVQDTFRHSCNTDNDCTLALLNATTCSLCSGQNAAIAKSDEAAYQIAFNQARANCPANGAPGTCARFYTVSQCNASKTCQIIQCGTTASVDEHHCTADGG